MPHPLPDDEDPPGFLPRGGNYQSPIYDGVLAKVCLTVSRQQLATGTYTIPWDIIFTTRSLRQYPEAISPIVITKTFNQVQPGKEQLPVSKSIRCTDQNNQVQQQALGETIPASATFQRVTISL